MRHTSQYSNRARNGVRFRPLWRSFCVMVWELVFVLNASDASAQAGFLTSPRELLVLDPRAVFEWLDSNRPKPMPPEDKSRILEWLPRQGRMTRFDGSARRKLASMQAFLRAAGHESRYDILVIEADIQARMVTYAASVIMVTEQVLHLLDVAELQAQLAHETGHLYLWTGSASDARRAKDVELFCDAIALVTLYRLGMDPSRLMTGIEKVTRYNWNFDGNVDERNYPTLGERQRYAREVIAWLKRGSDPPR